jgi:hypothetical protein
MSDALKGFVTVLVTIVLGIVGAIALDLAAGQPIALVIALAAGALFGLLYGLETGILLSYELDSGVGWAKLIIDLTWSLPNTVFGFVFGNIIYIFFGAPSQDLSKDKGWVAFSPRGSSGFGTDVLQTLGTVNLGGEGQHELMHVLQARIFGPLYLPIFAVNYAINFLIQVLFTCTVGAVLYKANVRTTPYFCPPSRSAVSGFFGWIYYSNLFELWAYSSGNP